MRRMPVGLCLGGVTEAGTMICNLPLLFADGYPTCLDKITADQLEKFVPFMIRCSGSDISKKLTAPEWWPNDLEFSIPLVKPQIAEAKWLTILKNLVSRCYTYHGCDFMLQFCTNLSQCPTKNLLFTTCWDGTTSLYNKATGKLLVTFRNENMCYDEREGCPRKKLLLDADGELVPSQSPVFDIYLCDSCDGEFSTLKEVKDHEKTCHRQPQDTSPCHIGAVDLNTVQEKFLNYFHLASTRCETEPDVEETADPPRHKRYYGNSLRYSSIPLSSPLGVLVNKKSRSFNFTAGVHLDRVERYCSAKPPESNVRVREPRSSSWPVTWKPRKKGEDELQEDWTHVYKHPKRQWKRRAPFMQDDMGFRAMELIKACQHFELRIKRLTEDEIKYYTTPRASGKANDSQNIAFNTVPNNYDEATIVEEMCVVSQTNDTEFNSAPVKTGPDYMEDIDSNSECLDNDGTADVLEPMTVSFERQLPPNTLYVYEKTAPNIGSQLENVSCDNPRIPVVDLATSDDELDIFTQREVGEHFVTLPHGYNERIQECETYMPDEVELDIEECGDSSNATTYSNEISDYCSDYGKDLPELIKFITSSTYQQSDETDLFMAIEQRDTITLNSEKSFPRPCCDKSVQCTYNDFDQADDDCDNVYDEDDANGDCCLVKEETCSQSALPQLFKNRREL